MNNQLNLKSINLLLLLAMMTAVSASAQPAGAPSAPPLPGANPQMQPSGTPPPGPGQAAAPARRGGRAGARGVGIQPPPTGRISPHETISANINNRVISITYGRPYSKDPATGAIRKVWGNLDLVPNPWRLGADEATLLLTPVDLAFGSVTIPAGAYTLYMSWPTTGPEQLVFSKSVGKWGIPVDTASDVAKVNLRKSDLNPANDQLLLAFDSAPAPATAAGAAPPATPPNPVVTLKIMWEGTQYAVDFTAKP